MRSLLIGCLCSAAWLAGCSPALDWREVRPEGSGVLAMFPCKPDSQTRSVALGPAQARLTLLNCSAAGATYALGHARIDDPAQVGPSLAALHAAMVSNIAGVEQASGEAGVAGMTPSPDARRIRVAGRLPNGDAAQAAMLFFVRGTTVFQATVIGPALDAQAVESFFSGLRVLP